MQEIKDNQTGNAQSRKKRFVILWSEQIDHTAEIRANSKEEALKLFYEYDDQISDTLEMGEGEMIGEPVVEEVSECD